MSDEDRQPPFEARLAGIVLQDCEHALHMLRQNPRGAEWRVTWCSILTLLRAVGHVLERDVKAPDAAPEMRKAWQEWFKRIGASKPEPPIFWQFIKNDRDALLKEYRFTAEQGVVLRRGAFGTMPFGAVPFGGGGVAEPTYLMKDGPFAGHDQRDLVQEAIAWWAAQLEEIALRAAADVLQKRWGF